MFSVQSPYMQDQSCGFCVGSRIHLYDVHGTEKVSFHTVLKCSGIYSQRTHDVPLILWLFHSNNIPCYSAGCSSFFHSLFILSTSSGGSVSIPRSFASETIPSINLAISLVSYSLVPFNCAY